MRGGDGQTERDEHGQKRPKDRNGGAESEDAWKDSEKAEEKPENKVGPPHRRETRGEGETPKRLEDLLHRREGG